MNADLSLLQAIAFEISVGCPLATLHAGVCPISDPHRWDNLDTSRPITDDIIIRSCVSAYDDMGFRGWITWHYFNEPLLAFDRIEHLIRTLRSLIPTFRTEVSTSGEVLPNDLSRLRCFDRIRLKNYRGHNHSKLDAIHPRVEYDDHPYLDNRMSIPPSLSSSRCRRLFDEMPIDHYGNGHICSGDWRGVVKIGNIWDIGITGVATNYIAIRDIISQEPMPATAPEHCRMCAVPDRTGDCIIDEIIFREVTQYRGY
jgi:hypothetical protein